MSSTSSTTSPDDVGSTSTEATGEDATRPFPAAGDTQPLTPPCALAVYSSERTHRNREPPPLRRMTRDIDG